MPKGQGVDMSSWHDDKLGRWEQAALLTDFLNAEYDHQTNLEGIKNHFVLNVDAPWGYGKTFFLERWQKDLQAEGHIALRYNAWANDFAKDPLMSFLSEIAPQLLSQLDDGPEGQTTCVANSERRARFIKATKRLINSLGPSIASRALTAGVSTLLVGIPFSADLSQGASSEDGNDAYKQAVDDALRSSMESFSEGATAKIFEPEQSRAHAVKEFQDQLRLVIQTIREERSHNPKSHFSLPIYIMIDELDRCRPDFTIELIECVKHIFSVDDIYFIFATDGEQLQAALQGTYGSKFNAEVYFNRIFTREVNLREPDNQKFAQALVQEYGVPIEESQKTLGLHAFALPEGEDQPSVAEDIRAVSDALNLTLRAQHHMVGAFSTIVRARHSRELETAVIPLLMLIALWQHDKNRFRIVLRDPDQYTTDTAWAELQRSVFPSGTSRGKFEAALTIPSNKRVYDRVSVSVLAYAALFLKSCAQHPGAQPRCRGGIERSGLVQPQKQEPKQSFVWFMEKENVLISQSSPPYNHLKEYFDHVMMLG